MIKWMLDIDTTKNCFSLLLISEDIPIQVPTIWICFLYTYTSYVDTQNVLYGQINILTYN